MMVARRLPVLGDVNASKASTLATMGAELNRVRAAVWARFSGAKTAHLPKRQIRDQLMGENAPKEFGVPQRLRRATVEDTVDKIRAWQRGIVFDTEINAARNILARATDPLISRYTPTHEVKRILTRRAGTVENCPTTTQAATSTIVGGCERNNLPSKRRTIPKR